MQHSTVICGSDGLLQQEQLSIVKVKKNQEKKQGHTLRAEVPITATLVYNKHKVKEATDRKSRTVYKGKTTK